MWINYNLPLYFLKFLNNFYWFYRKFIKKKKENNHFKYLNLKLVKIEFFNKKYFLLINIKLINKKIIIKIKIIKNIKFIKI